MGERLFAAYWMCLLSFFDVWRSLVLVFFIKGYMVSEPPRCGHIGRVMFGFPWVMCRGEGEVFI